MQAKHDPESPAPPPGPHDWLVPTFSSAVSAFVAVTLLYLLRPGFDLAERLPVSGTRERIFVTGLFLAAGLALLRSVLQARRARALWQGARRPEGD